MKIELLKNAFSGVSHREASALAAMPTVPRKRCQLPVASSHLNEVNGAAVVERTRILALMSKIFDPQCMTQDKAEGLINLLQDADLLAEKEVRFIRGQVREGIKQSGVVDLIFIARSVMPTSSNKDNLLALLNNAVGLRYRAAS